jgi:hypothetical protein
MAKKPHRTSLSDLAKAPISAPAYDTSVPHDMTGTRELYAAFTEIVHCSRILDHILLRKAVKSMQNDVARVDAKRLAFTAKETTEWAAICDGAMKEDKCDKLLQHALKIINFWEAYRD